MERSRFEGGTKIGLGSKRIPRHVWNLTLHIGDILNDTGVCVCSGGGSIRSRFFRRWADVSLVFGEFAAQVFLFGKGPGGMGSLGSIGMGYLASEGQVCQNFCKNYYIRRVG